MISREISIATEVLRRYSATSATYQTGTLASRLDIKSEGTRSQSRHQPRKEVGWISSHQEPIDSHAAIHTVDSGPPSRLERITPVVRCGYLTSLLASRLN